MAKVDKPGKGGTIGDERNGEVKLYEYCSTFRRLRQTLVAIVQRLPVKAIFEAVKE
jgi:hypothetical protein